MTVKNIQIRNDQVLIIEMYVYLVGQLYIIFHLFSCKESMNNISVEFCRVNVDIMKSETIRLTKPYVLSVKRQAQTNCYMVQNLS